MDNLNDYCPGYEPFPEFDDPFTFQASSTYTNNNTKFSTASNTLYDIGPNTMSHYPTTPSSRQSGRELYPASSTEFVTPYGQQFNHSTDYPYACYGMSMQQTPIPAMTYSGHAPNLPGPLPPVPEFDFVSYDGGSQSFSDSSSTLAGVNTPTSKQHDMPTPTQSPQSPQSEGQDLPTVPLSQLQYSNFDEAEAEASGRTPLRVEDDDWMFVESDKKIHVAAIMAAFDAPFKPKPNVPLTDTEELRWVKYQTEQAEKVDKYLVKSPKSKELSAWLLLEALLDTHKLGYKKGFRIADPYKCCSERFAQMVRAVRNYAVIRFDLVRMQRLDDLATSPSHAVSRKVANWRGNAGKVKRDEANQKEAAAHGVEYANVLGVKRKYKPLHAEPTEEDDEGNEYMSGFDSPFDTQQGTKRNAGDHGDDDKDFTPSATPSTGGRKTVPAAKRVKYTFVVAGPDVDI